MSIKTEEMSLNIKTETICFKHPFIYVREFPGSPLLCILHIHRETIGIESAKSNDNVAVKIVIYILQYNFKLVTGNKIYSSFFSTLPQYKNKTPHRVIFYYLMYLFLLETSLFPAFRSSAQSAIYNFMQFLMPRR